jgi:hypothetical protein
MATLVKKQVMVNYISTLFKTGIMFLIVNLLFSCKQVPASFTSTNAIAVKDSVLKLADSSAHDITAKGPIAWVNYFEDSPGFFMASDGVIAFPDYHAADTFIKNTLVKQFPRISLKWSNIRVDVYTSQIAVMGADFHEDLTDANGKITSFDGYFTATAHQAAKGWKYRDVHWSIKKGK